MIMEKLFSIWLMTTIIIIILAFIFRKEIAETLKTVFASIFQKGKGYKKEGMKEKGDSDDEMSILNFLLRTEEGQRILNESPEGKKYLNEMALSEADIANSELNVKMLKAQLEELGLWKKLQDKLSKTESKVWRFLKGFLRILFSRYILTMIATVVVIILLCKYI